MKTCKIHDLLRQLCLSEAHTENVVHVMNGNVLEAIDDKCRMILLSEVEEKHDYRMQHSSGIIRTFISMQGDFPIRMCSIVSQFKLLKVLDVLAACDFSCVIPQLVHLRYVDVQIKKAVSLAKMRNLQTIIIRRYFYLGPQTLKQPLDIWRMSEIRHLDINSPLYISNPVEAEQALFLNNLQTLILHNAPFVAEIIRRTPNLKRLKIFDMSELPDFLDSLSILQDLETLHIQTQENIDPMIISRDISLPNLKTLKLRHTRIPWEVVNFLANLPNLEVLQGDLERWELAAGSDSFPVLEQLILTSFHKLEEIPESIGEIMTLKFIEIVHCSSSVDNSAKRIQEEQENLGNYELQVSITRKYWED